MGGGEAESCPKDLSAQWGKGVGCVRQPASITRFTLRPVGPPAQFWDPMPFANSAINKIARRIDKVAGSEHSTLTSGPQRAPRAGGRGRPGSTPDPRQAAERPGPYGPTVAPGAPHHDDPGRPPQTFDPSKFSSWGVVRRLRYLRYKAYFCGVDRSYVVFFEHTSKEYVGTYDVTGATVEPVEKDGFKVCLPGYHDDWFFKCDLDAEAEAWIHVFMKAGTMQ